MSGVADEWKVQIVGALKPDTLLDAMAGFEKNAEVQINCNNLLGIFALESAAHRELILRRRGYENTLRAMGDFPQDHRMQEIGCWCLRAMSSSSLPAPPQQATSHKQHNRDVCAPHEQRNCARRSLCGRCQCLLRR